MRVLDAVVNEDGGVRLLDPIRLREGQRLVVTVLEEGKDAEGHDLRRLEGIFRDERRSPVSIEAMNEAIRKAGAGQ